MVHWCFLHVWNIVSVCFYQIWYSYLTLLICFLLHKWEHTNTVTETCCKCCRNTVSLLSVYDDVGSSWQFLQCISDDTQINCDKSANNPVHIQTVTFKINAHLATTFALCILPVLQEYNQNANSWHLSWVPVLVHYCYTKYCDTSGHYYLCLTVVFASYFLKSLHFTSCFILKVHFSEDSFELLSPTPHTHFLP